MATSITPKSVFREVKSISHGYGEVPIAEVDGRKGYALPGGEITYSLKKAQEVAQWVDACFRRQAKNKELCN